jgi:hypothetical protein
MSTLAEPIEQLLKRWYRRAKVDCDPANGSATVQAQGRATAKCADELAAALAESQPQARDLDRAANALLLIEHITGKYDIAVSEAAKKMLATQFAEVRAEAKGPRCADELAARDGSVAAGLYAETKPYFSTIGAPASANPRAKAKGPR